MLTVTVFRAVERGDCSMNGISSRSRRLCLVNVDGPSFCTPSAESSIPDGPDSALPAMLVPGNLPGTLKIVPAQLVNEATGRYAPIMGGMMGGNYAATSDSRFSEACEKILGSTFYGAVAIHDRFE